MYKELISKLIADNQWAELQKPCGESEIEKAEKYVGYAFPAELRALLLETNGDNYLLLSVDQIIENVKLNRSILAECFDSVEEFKEKIDNHIFFATNGCGDYYCYRILPSGKADTSAIYIWEHEIFECSVVAKNMTDFITRYYNGEI